MAEVVCVGLGPFNLGLAALADPVADLSVRVVERRPGFSWHPGLMLPDAEVQVPFLADLVTMADPTNPHSALNYLHERDRLYRFYFRERMHLLRAEFDAYCRWVVDRVGGCEFGATATGLRRGRDGGWEVQVRCGERGAHTLRADAVVLGVGGEPHVPDCAAALIDTHPAVLHSADYLAHRDRLQRADRVMVIGSGQSAAEVMADLLDHLPAGASRSWYTRSAGFLPMEYSKLGLEHFTPEYTAHFHGLPEDTRDRLRAHQDLLYKGISADTSARIYDRLYAMGADGDDTSDRIDYRSRCRMDRVTACPDGTVEVQLFHLDQGCRFVRRVDAVVLATGYRPTPLPLGELADVVARDRSGRPVVERDYRLRLTDGGPSTIFVQNAELHTHGVGTPDLGLAAHRNAVIINAIAGRPVYAVRERNVFQRFGAPS